MCFATTAYFLPLLSNVLFLASTSLARSHSNDADNMSNVMWEQPASGSAYNTGDTVDAQWTARSEVVSPSFRLCEYSGPLPRDIFLEASRNNPLELWNKFARDDGDDDDDCGTIIWPAIKRADDGSYQVSLGVPEMLPGSFYLLMRDDFGSLAQSPVFSVSAALGPKNETASTGVEAMPQPSQSQKHKSIDPASVTPTDQASMNTSVDAGRNTSNAGQVLANPQPMQVPLTSQNATSSSGSISNGTVSLPKPMPSIPRGPIYIDSNNLLTSRHPTPVAAFAIPLSAAAAALLIAGCLAIRHHRTLKKEREKDRLTVRLLEKLHSDTLASSSSLPSLRYNDNVKHTFNTLPAAQPMQIQPIPLFMPMPVSLSMDRASGSSSLRRAGLPEYPVTYEPREITRQAFPYRSPLDHSTSGRAYSHSMSGNAGRYRSGIPSPPASLSRSRNLSLARWDHSSFSGLTRNGGTRRNSTFSIPHLPPLSFSSSSNNGAFGSLLHTGNQHSMSKKGSEISNSCTTSDILEDYCLPPPRPIPTSIVASDLAQCARGPRPLLPPSLLSAPQRLHVRDEAPSVAPEFSAGATTDGLSVDKPLPSRPSSVESKYGESDVYAAVASLLDKPCP
ncbi:hypothetical protein AX17_006317 [Amanita inopinata Kibby_2008]|nr:hypothetical protein AX17_006317 [Amanita inopinata Kibby_2008]